MFKFLSKENIETTLSFTNIVDRKAGNTIVTFTGYSEERIQNFIDSFTKDRTRVLVARTNRRVFKKLNKNWLYILVWFIGSLIGCWLAYYFLIDVFHFYGAKL